MTIHITPHGTATPNPVAARIAAEAEEAAKEWAEADDWHSAEYQIVAQKWEPVVTVKDNRDGEVKKFTVTGEAVPSYHATETT